MPLTGSVLVFDSKQKNKRVKCLARDLKLLFGEIAGKIVCWRRATQTFTAARAPDERSSLPQESKETKEGFPLLRQERRPDGVRRLRTFRENLSSPYDWTTSDFRIWTDAKTTPRSHNPDSDWFFVQAETISLDFYIDGRPASRSTNTTEHHWQWRVGCWNQTNTKTTFIVVTSAASRHRNVLGLFTHLSAKNTIKNGHVRSSWINIFCLLRVQILPAWKNGDKKKKENKLTSLHFQCDTFFFNTRNFTFSSF